MQDQPQPVIGGGIVRGHNNLVLDSFPLFYVYCSGCSKSSNESRWWVVSFEWMTPTHPLPVTMTRGLLKEAVQNSDGPPWCVCVCLHLFLCAAHTKMSLLLICGGLTLGQV